MSAPLTLISFPLCPYVQRASILLDEKGIAFTRKDIDLANKPDWFMALSPTGKVPLLLVGDEVLFESSVICEYLDETTQPRLHPEDPLQRARHRAWMEVGSALLGVMWSFYTTRDETALQDKAEDIRRRLAGIERQLAEGPYFAGPAFSMVDAVFAPIFRYFPVFEMAGFDFLSAYPKTKQWREALLARPSVQKAVRADFQAGLIEHIRHQQSLLGQRL